MVICSYPDRGVIRDVDQSTGAVSGVVIALLLGFEVLIGNTECFEIRPLWDETRGQLRHVGTDLPAHEKFRGRQATPGERR